MEITHTTIPGVGTVHHCYTRAGQRLGVLVDSTNRCYVLTYNADDAEPAQQVLLESDEADLFAELLHSQSIQDRLAALERRIADLTSGTP